MDFTDLPGGKLVEIGLRDVLAGTESVESLLVRIGGPRLRRLGLHVPHQPGVGDAELLLYRRLLADGVADAYSRYNALLRELVSFERALERACARARRGRAPRA